MAHTGATPCTQGLVPKGRKQARCPAAIFRRGRKAGGDTGRIAGHAAARRGAGAPPDARTGGYPGQPGPALWLARKSVVEGKSVSVRLGRGGRRCLKKKKQKILR